MQRCREYRENDVIEEKHPANRWKASGRVSRIVLTNRLQSAWMCSNSYNAGAPNNASKHSTRRTLAPMGYSRWTVQVPLLSRGNKKEKFQWAKEISEKTFPGRMNPDRTMLIGGSELGASSMNQRTFPSGVYSSDWWKWHKCVGNDFFAHSELLPLWRPKEVQQATRWVYLRKWYFTVCVGRKKNRQG